jgi:hypothetical protein
MPSGVFDLMLFARLRCLLNPSASATADVESDDVDLAPRGFDSLPWDACGPSSCEVHDGAPCWIAGEDAASGLDAKAVLVVADPAICSASSATGASLSWIDFASPGEGAALGADANAMSVVADLSTCSASSGFEGASLCWMDLRMRARTPLQRRFCRIRRVVASLLADCFPPERNAGHCGRWVGRYQMMLILASTTVIEVANAEQCLRMLLELGWRLRWRQRA